MRKRSLVNLIFPAMALMSVSSCQDYDANFSQEALLKQEYADHFEKVFGKVDPNQDWSMAATLTASVPSGNVQISVYSDKPAYASGSLLAVIDSNNKVFNANKGAEQVFAVIRENGLVSTQGYYNVDNGMVDFTNAPVAKKTSITRSGAANGVTVMVDGDGNPVIMDTGLRAAPLSSGTDPEPEPTEKYFFYQNVSSVWTPFGPYDTWNDMCNAYIAYGVEQGWGDAATIAGWNHFNSTKDTNGNWIEPAQLPNGFTKEIPSGGNSGAANIEIKVTYLSGQTTTPAEPYVYRDYYDYFGKGAFFMEQEYYFGKKSNFDKNELYGETDAEKLAMLKKIEAGFSIVSTGKTDATDGSISLPFIYGATNNKNQFGYIYYKNGEDPLTKPHYILMNNGTPQGNIHWNSANGTAVGEMELSNMAYNLRENCTTNQVYGTVHKLTFFGENYDEAGTYEFPAGYNILFFICPVSSFASDGTAAGFNNGNFNYSVPSYNNRIGHNNDNVSNSTYKNNVIYTSGEYQKGAVKAGAWYDEGTYFLGFEDGGNDEDLNDIVFWVEGDFVPAGDIVEVIKDEATSSWLFASEDLGGTFDYDFNDVVWEATKTYKVERTIHNDGHITTNFTYLNGGVNILAAGGTLPVELYYNATNLTANDMSEIHQIFGQEEAETYTPVNVLSSKVESNPVALTGVSIEESTNINTVYGNFKVKVIGKDGESYFVESPKNGTEVEKANEAPQIILLPGQWEWPTENTPITTAYDGFDSWVTNATWTQWSTYKKAGTTVRRK